MLAWAASMTWKGLHPIIKLNSTIYQKGISLNKSAMKEVEKRLEPTFRTSTFTARKL